VERLVLLPLARAIAGGEAREGSILRLHARGSGLSVEVVPPRAEAASDPSPKGAPAAEIRGLTARAEALARRIDALRALARPMEEDKLGLMERAKQRDFWSAKAEARAVLDDVYRIDGVLRALEDLDQATRADPGAPKEMAELERRADHLELLFASKSPDRLADAFVELRLVSSQGEGLGAVETLTRMYMAFAARHGFEVVVLNDRLGGDPTEDAAALLVTGPGAHALLAAEAGLHEVMRGARPARDGRGRRTRDDDETRPSDRDVVRVEVLPAPAEPRPFSRDEVRVDVRPLGREHRRLARPRWEITLLHLPTMVTMHVWSESRTDATLERLSAYLRARVDAGARAATRGDAPPESMPIPAALVAVVRRYALGPTPFVRDLRTGKKTAKVQRVLEGRIEMFLGRTTQEA
jgi:protein subunit release factor A